MSNTHVANADKDVVTALLTAYTASKDRTSPFCITRASYSVWALSQYLV